MRAVLTDPMERLVQTALETAGIEHQIGDDSPARLDFYLPALDVHIEVKRLHSPRIAEQMSRADNVIVAQGDKAVEFLAALIGRAEDAQPSDPRENLGWWVGDGR